MSGHAMTKLRAPGMAPWASGLRGLRALAVGLLAVAPSACGGGAAPAVVRIEPPPGLADAGTKRAATGGVGAATAMDAHGEALMKQLTGRWGWAEDKDGQLRVPMVDWRGYDRVRYWAVDHFVGFKYGDDFHVMNSVFILDVTDGGPIDAEHCLRRAEKWGYPQLKSFEVKLEPGKVSHSRWRNQNVLVKSMEGYVDFGLERHHFSAAYAAYPAYSDACLIFGVAVPWREHEDLAEQVRDRWVKEAVGQIRPLTPTRPHRK